MVAVQGRPTKVSVRNAVGIVRVSEVNGREGERFVSPREQESSIQRACEREEMKLVRVFHELDVSGFSRKLTARPGLSEAVAMVERGEADVIMVAYFDRLFRSMKVQEEVCERVEIAGGQLHAVDAGEIRQDTASHWLQSRMLGMVAEHTSRITREKTQGPKERAIAAGIPTFPNIPPGYRQREDRRLELDEAKAALVREAFLRRAGELAPTQPAPQSLTSVFRWAQSVGLTRTFRGTQEMLKNRMYLGELRFGKLVNLHSHPPIIDAALFDRVQQMRTPRGRRGESSDRLLARQGLLVCGTCGSRMVVGRQVRTRADGTKRTFVDYRCPPLGNCPARATIDADLVDNAVEGFLELLQDTTYSAINDQVADAEAEVEETEKALSVAVAAFDGMGDVAAVRSKLQQLHAAHQAATEQLQSVQATAAGSAGLAIRDWYDYSVAQRRALLRSLIKRITVRRGGRGTERITIEGYEQPYAF